MTNCPQPHRQDELLVFLRAQFEAHGVSPTWDQMLAHMGVRSKSSLHRMIAGLKRRKLVRQTPKIRCGLQLLQTEDYHLPGCGCDRCSQLRQIQGLKVNPPFAVVRARADNFRLLSDETRNALLGTNNAAPRTRTAIPSGVR